MISQDLDYSTLLLRDANADLKKLVYKTKKLSQFKARVANLTIGKSKLQVSSSTDVTSKGKMGNYK